jgi:shikimate kinase/3-dehydroquinate synthase
VARRHYSQLSRTLVLVGLMGAGKSSVGRRLATRLGLPFRDADHEIEAAAGCSIQQIYVLATGGGTYLVPETRRLNTDGRSLEATVERVLAMLERISAGAATC